MNKIQLFFHYLFRFIWNLIFVISYPILASFGLLFIGLTWIFSKLSQLLARIRPEGKKVTIKASDWETLPHTNELIEALEVKSIMFGPSGFKLRRVDGVPSILSDYVFGNKVRVIEEGLILEKWNSTDSKELPDFDICLYNPDEDSLRPLTNIKCFDWHVSERGERELFFKWFDGTQGGEVKVAL
ncbi:hypothetical protein OU792_06345 [Algoriphagus sp. NF]|jgi:hypothetical protein|uniref:Uncharacterized protein n=2 Tax=Algoriphagus TaxID=246875 RepID=A0ABS7N2B6_9BACT|nr:MULTISPECIES: hypothetical protein [Algoriphagus]MBY5950437.1 hypothetical protein [Algoriphagus marincola]MCR9083258.1 hypothetical protein [Cyclobacteriaceae bacterium]MDE0559600.1 hypothetical protein [Algoriphagus sp. NF]TDK42576.1 hypothetical protein E1898_14120 [Algoriphagus aquimaris]